MTWSVPDLPSVDPSLEPRLRAAIDGKAKPLGALGRLEDLAVQLGLIQDRTDPRMDRISALVFAGDHGLTAEGVSAFPQSVTAAMVGLFLDGRATVNAFAAATGVDVQVVDIGVISDMPPHPALTAMKVANGTRNSAREPAMSPDECVLALQRGFEIGSSTQADAVALGEMGIGNTAAASLLMHRLTGTPLQDCIGAGAGHDSPGLARKTAAIERAAARSDAVDPIEILRQFGGMELCGMAGAALGAACARRAVIVDGFISSAAVLAAIRMRPALADYCVWSHCSAERGHARLLEAVGARPLLQLDLRLGEGTGAVLVAPLLRAAARLLTDVADLAEVVRP